MTNILKIVSTFFLAITLIGCQGDSSEEASQQADQQSNALSQMQQPAPDVEVSEDEAATFADAAMNAQKIQMQAQKKMISAIQEEGLDIQTYQKIARSQQMGQSSDSVDFTDEEMTKFDSANVAIQGLQKEIQQDVTEAIEETGMKMQRFQDISRAAQQDSALQMKIQQQIQQKMSGQIQQQAPTQQN